MGSAASRSFPPEGSPPETPRRERILTRPLVLFLVAVALIVGFGLRSKYPTPDMDGAILMLADGDLDGKERRRMLQITLDGALQSQSVTHRWAGMLAAVALEDRTSYATLLARLGSGPMPTAVPAEADRELLHLGDPLLGNLMQAMIAETAGDLPRSGPIWRQIAVQCRLSGGGRLAAELAEAAAQRHQTAAKDRKGG
ncbi:MAG TPA: hypothetical protein VFD82_16050 [Planctomycetota bacterium]|nr:hypothetical protein [Planctomycetota bacterium]